MISALAGAEGGVRDGWSLLTNVEGNLVLLGPGLVISNIVVRWLQRQRARQQVEPLVGAAGRLCCEGFRTAQQALRLLGSETQLPMPVARIGFVALSTQLGSAHSEIVNLMDSLIASDKLPPSFRPVHPLSFPNFGLINAFVQGADRHYPMPEAVLMSAISREYAKGCGFEFIYMQNLGGGSHVRHVGLARITQESESANPTTTGVFAHNYLKVAVECVFRTHVIALCLAHEGPPGSLIDVPDDSDPYWLQ